MTANSANRVNEAAVTSLIGQSIGRADPGFLEPSELPRLSGGRVARVS